MQHNTLSGHTGEQEASGQGHRTRNTTHQAGKRVSRSQVVKDTAQATPQTEHVHRWTGAKWPRTSHTQHNTRSRHIGERERSGQGHCTHNVTHQRGTPVNGSQMTKDNAQATQHTRRAHR